jgi:hypothetical protein
MPVFGGQSPCASQGSRAVHRSRPEPVLVAEGGGAEGNGGSCVYESGTVPAQHVQGPEFNASSTNK